MKTNGGGGRIRTAEPTGSGFTVRRVWPLRYPSIYASMVPAAGLEPATY
jgi:hypothetical protein